MKWLKGVQREIKDYGLSFKPNSRFIKIFAICLVFAFILLIGGMSWQNVLTWQSDNVMAEYAKVSNKDDIPQLQNFIGSFQLFLLYLGLATIGLVLVFLFGWGISRTLIWGEMLNFKFTKRVALKCTLLKFCWQLVWLPIHILLIVPLFMFSRVVQEQPSLNIYLAILLYFTILVFLIMAYFGLFMYYSFFNKKRIYLAMTESFRDGVKNLKFMLFPILQLLVTFSLMYIIAKFIIPSLAFLNILLLLYLITATKIYIINKVKRVMGGRIKAFIKP